MKPQHFQLRRQILTSKYVAEKLRPAIMKVGSLEVGQERWITPGMEGVKLPMQGPAQPTLTFSAKIF